MENKRILIFLQRRFARWGHALAIELKQMGFNDFACYSLPLSSAKFLKEQKDIVYNPFVIDQEVIKDYKSEAIDFEYLKKKEAEYGNLWHYIYLDRYMIMSHQQTSYEPNYTYKEMLQILQLRIKAIEKMFDDFKPDAVLFSSISIMPSILMYQIAKKKGVKVLQITHTRVGKQVGICQTLGEYTKIKQGFQSNQIISDEARAFLKDFQEKTEGRVYHYKPSKPAFFLIRVLGIVKFALTHFYRSYFTYRKHDYTEEKFFDYLKTRFLRKYNAVIGHKGLFSDIVEGEKSIFYPLHFEPEAATLIFAPYYTNQIELISSIAKSLPVDYRLYVKDHPMMRNMRKRSYYKKILRNRNVRLISPRVPSQKIIKHSDLIVNITSTAGWEGILLDKPVITFGDCFYNIFSQVKKCQNISDLPSLIKSQIESFDTAANQKEVLDYLTSVFENSIKMDLFGIWEENTFEEVAKQHKMKPLAEFIAKSITGV